MKKTIFLDRDGVISKYYPKDYSKKWEEFSFLPGAKEALKKLTEANYQIVIISNQAGVSKGLFGPKVLRYITKRMKEEIKNPGGESKRHTIAHIPIRITVPAANQKPDYSKKRKRPWDLLILQRPFLLATAK